jgi:hypothetical protein
VAAGALLTACGDDPAVDAPGQATTATTVASTTGPASMDLTTTDGYRYKVSMLVGAPSPTGAPDCPGTATAGKVYLPVTLTVANVATDRPAPFPPVRVELAGAPGTKPGQVMLRDPAGQCTFSPRQPSIAAGASAVFTGTSPAIDATAAPGSAGQIEVKVSETTFSLYTRVP